MTSRRPPMGRLGTSVLMFAMTIFFGAYAVMGMATDEAPASRGVQTDATVVHQRWDQVDITFRDQQGRLVEVTDAHSASVVPEVVAAPAGR